MKYMTFVSQVVRQTAGSALPDFYLPFPNRYRKIPRISSPNKLPSGSKTALGCQLHSHLGDRLGSATETNKKQSLVHYQRSVLVQDAQARSKAPLSTSPVPPSLPPYAVILGLRGIQQIGDHA
jgi:hypothetical protein